MKREPWSSFFALMVLSRTGLTKKTASRRKNKELRRRMDRALRLLGTCSGEEDAAHILEQMIAGWL